MSKIIKKVTIEYEDGSFIYVEGDMAKGWSERIDIIESVCSVRPYLNLPKIKWESSE